MEVLAMSGSLRKGSFNTAFVTRAAEKFDQDLRLTDEATRAQVRKHLEALMVWAARLTAKP